MSSGGAAADSEALHPNDIWLLFATHWLTDFYVLMYNLVVIVTVIFKHGSSTSFYNLWSRSTHKYNYPYILSCT